MWFRSFTKILCGFSYRLIAIKFGHVPRGGGTSILGGRGLGPHIKFGGKIWDKVQPSSLNKRKNLGSFNLLPQNAKVGKKSRFWGHI